MSLRERITSLLSLSGKRYTMKEIYTEFPDIKKSTIRGRVYDSIGKGVTKIDKNLYISSEAIVELGNSLELIDTMIEKGDKFNYIFLDIPYSAGGQRGGNRNLFDCNTITPEQFREFAIKLEKLLVDDNSIISFMFTSGKSSRRAHDKYLKGFESTRLIMCEKVGTYTKLWSNGNRMNMGKHLMPEENIYLFNRSGIIQNIEDLELQFSDVPKLREYPTSKPIGVVTNLVKQLSKSGDWVFDPFGGSGKTLEACLYLNRKCHIIDSSERSFNNHLIPILRT